MEKQMDVFDFVEDTRDFIDLNVSVQEDEITQEITKNFDYQFNGTVEEHIFVPTFPKEFGIGAIVGSSGSGKSTILKEKFGEEEKITWEYDKPIASHFDSYEDASQKLGGVGLNSIPTWLKPYRVLSNGEKFRADMARRLKNDAVIDEFTSVVNRECAISCSTSIAKYIRRNNLHNIVFCSCHDDILPYLQPDWVYNTDTHEFYSGRYLRRPKIEIEIVHCRKEVWNIFKKYHYLSGDLNSASACYMALFNGIPIGFVAILALPSMHLKHAFREHRVVVLPDYQGMGIGNKLSETIGQLYREKGCRYFAKTSNPRMGMHRDKSPLWRATVHNHKDRREYFKKDGSLKSDFYHMDLEKRRMHSQRVCYCHEYVGDGTVYPYTYDKQIEEPKQMCITDFWDF